MRLSSSLITTLLKVGKFNFIPCMCCTNHDMYVICISYMLHLQIRFIARPELIAEDLAANTSFVAAPMLDYYQDYFDHEYDFPKSGIAIYFSLCSINICHKVFSLQDMKQKYVML